MTEREEVAWFSSPPNAMLKGDNEIKYLHFIDPRGDRAVIPVTSGSSDEASSSSRNVWHFEMQDQTVTVSPSIYFIGKWHSPNPVTFILVDEL